VLDRGRFAQVLWSAANSQWYLSAIFVVCFGALTMESNFPEKGVTIPSQMRYVQYMDLYCRMRLSLLPPPAPFRVWFQGITIKNYPQSIRDKENELWFVVEQPMSDEPAFSSKGAARIERGNVLPNLNLMVRPLQLDDDVHISVYMAKRFGKAKLFEFWFNTRFLAFQLPDGDLTFVSQAAAACEQAASANLELDDGEDLYDDDDDDKESVLGESPSKENKKEAKKAQKKAMQQKAQALQFHPKVLGTVEKVPLALRPGQDQRFGYMLELNKWIIDKTCKDFTNKKFPEDFCVQILFVPAENAAK